MRVEAIRKGQHFIVPELERLGIDKDSVSLSFDYEAYLKGPNAGVGAVPPAKPGSLQERLNEILGQNARLREAVSIGEDKRMYLEALQEKYGQ